MMLFALSLAVVVSTVVAVVALSAVIDGSRQALRYREGLQKIANMSIHAAPGSVFSTEAEWAKAVAKAALYPPSLKPRIPKAVQQLDQVRRR